MRFTRLLSLPLAFMIYGAAFAGTAQPQRVVELFTSQGCSSCPPANIFVGDVAKDETALVLSYGVTYWDYLGWTDTFAKPEFTYRQKAYAKAFGSANVYTPQIILNGSAHGSRYTHQDVNSMDLPQGGPDINLIKVSGFLHAQPSGKLKQNYVATLVEYVDGPQSVPVDAGENQGRVLTLTNVVTDITLLGRWTDGKTLKTGIEPKAGKSYALLLHDPKSSKLVAALIHAPD